MTKQPDLGAMVRLLGDMLGETIIEQAGTELFDLVEQMRAHSKAWRAGDAQVGIRLQQLVPHLADNLDQALGILQAFTTYFQLVNLAEEHYRVRILRQRSQKSWPTRDCRCANPSGPP